MLYNAERFWSWNNLNKEASWYSTLNVPPVSSWAGFSELALEGKSTHKCCSQILLDIMRQCSPVSQQDFRVFPQVEPQVTGQEQDMTSLTMPPLLFTWEDPVAITTKAHHPGPEPLRSSYDLHGGENHYYKGVEGSPYNSGSGASMTGHAKGCFA